MTKPNTQPGEKKILEDAVDVSTGERLPSEHRDTPADDGKVILAQGLIYAGWACFFVSVAVFLGVFWWPFGILLVKYAGIAEVGIFVGIFLAAIGYVLRWLRTPFQE